MPFGDADVVAFGEGDAPAVPPFGQNDALAFGAADVPAFGEEDTPLEAFGQNLLEIGKGIPEGAVGIVGTALKGLGALSQSDRAAMQPWVDLLRGAPHASPEDRAAWRRRAFAELTKPQAEAFQRALSDIEAGDDPAEAAEIMYPLFSAETVRETPFFEAGEATTEFAKGLVPAAPGYEESIGRQLGVGLGSVAAGAGTGLLPGGQALGPAMFALAGSGEAADRAVRAGASEDQIIEAARKGIIPGMTDSLPVETLLGRIPVPGGKLIKVPVGMLGAALRAVGRIGWQAFIEGVQEGGQGFLQNLIARDIYAPEQKLGEGVVPEAGIGAGVGAIAETGRLALKGFAGRRGGGAIPVPQMEGAPLPEGAQPAAAVLGEEFGEGDETAFGAGAPIVPAPAPPAPAPLPEAEQLRRKADELEARAAALAEAQDEAGVALADIEEGVTAVEEAPEAPTAPEPTPAAPTPPPEPPTAPSAPETAPGALPRVRGKPAAQPKGPVDMLRFLAAKGGIRDDEGHDLARGRGGARFIPGVGPLIRPTGMIIDDAGEALWEAGYFGPPDTTPRPTEAEVLDKLDAAFRRHKLLTPEQQAEAVPRETDEVEIEQAAANLGVELESADLAIVRDALDNGLDLEDAIERAAIQAEAAAVGAYLDITPDAEEVTFDAPEPTAVEAEPAAEGAGALAAPEGAREARPAGASPEDVARGQERGRAGEAPEAVTETTPPSEAPTSPSGPEIAAIGTAKTGQVATFGVFSGHGRGSRAQVYNPANESDMAILGPARYAATSEAAAREFGPEIDKTPITLNNPLVIDDDSIWRDLTQRAGWKYPNPFGLPKQETEAGIRKLRSQLEAAGYDGVIIRLSQYDSTKLVRNMFGIDQVIDFKAPAPTAPEPTPQGEQAVIPGAERIGDRELAERRMEGRKRATRPQAEADEGLFDVGGRGQDELFSLGRRRAPGFFSALERAVEGLDLPRAPAEQWRQTIKKLPGVKAEEIEWTGLNEWLDSSTEPVNKDDLLNFLRAGGVRVEEVVKGDLDFSSSVQDLDGIADELFGKPYGDLSGSEKATVQNQLFQGRNDPTKFADYQLPGGENYRELVLTLPVGARRTQADDDYNSLVSDLAAEQDISRDLAIEVIEEIIVGQDLTGGMSPDLFDRARGLRGEERKAFTGGHFDEPNVLAHVRFNERISYDPGKPDRGGITSENFFRREMEAVLPLEVVHSGVIGLAHYDQVQRAIVAALPVDVVNLFKTLKLAPKDLFSDKAVSARAVFLGADHVVRARISSGLGTALGKTEASLRAKVFDSLSTGLDKELFPTLRTSDLDGAVVRRLLAPHKMRRADALQSESAGAASGATLADTAGAGAELSVADRAAFFDGFAHARLGAPTGTRGFVGRDGVIPAARLAELLDAHTQIIADNQRTYSEPKRVLFIEELQSDWHQKGRREGYRQTERYNELLNKHRGGRATDTEVEELNRLNLAEVKAVPDAPFKKTWPDLMFKRMIRWAADNGFDSIAWTTGDHQVIRYESALRQAVDEIRWDKTADGIHLIGFKGKGRSLTEPENDERIRLGLQGRLNARDEARFRELDQMRPPKKVIDTTEREDALSDAVGKAIAKQIIENPAQSGAIKGDDLRIDSTGMAAFYDRQLPRVANKIGKKYGAKAGTADIGVRATTAGGQIQIAGAGEQSISVHALPITPELRDAVLQGQPLFRFGDRDRPAKPFDTDALRQRLADLGMAGKVALRVVEQIGRGAGTEGRYVNRAITVAMDAADGVWTLNHEAVHALKDMDLIRPGEWRTLEAMAKADAPRLDEIRERYAGQPLNEDQLIEEAVADTFADWADGRAKVAGPIRNLFERIRVFLQKLGAALKGEGFTSAREVLARIHGGEVGRRPPPGRAREPRERLSLSPETPDSNEARQDAQQGFIASGQPLDRAMRIPFDWFGGVNEKGEWKPGAKLFDKARNAVTGAKFSPEGRFSWLNGPLEAARFGLIDRYGLAEEYVTRERKRDLDARAIAVEGADILKTLAEQNVQIEEARVLQAILTGEDVADADMAKLAVPIRQAVDELGQEAVSLGLVSAESYERNRGSYLHRVYMKHEADQPHLSRWFGAFMTGKRKKILGDALKGRGMFLEVERGRMMRDIPAFAAGALGLPQKGGRYTVLDKYAAQEELEQIGAGPARIERRVYWPAEEAIPDRYKDFTDNGDWEVRGARGRKIVLWRDYTKAERERMGEITDARYTIGKTFMLMANDLATGRFYKDIAENEDWSRTDQPDGKWVDAAEFGRLWHDQTVEWVRVPGTAIPQSGGKKRWGALAGHWVRPEIWRDLNEIDAMSRPNMWTKLLTQWKLNKTARSPVVHMNNIMSNFVFMDLADVRVQDLVRGIRAYATGSADFREAADHGAFGADIISQEIRREVLMPILKDLEREMTGTANPALSRFGVLGGIAGAIWDKGKMVDRKMVDMYRLEDEIFRMGMYMRRRSLGESAEDAALEARQQFLDYDIRAPWVNMARRSVLPFIAYSYRAAPLIARSIATRPWKLGKYFMLAYAANALAYMVAPGDDDEEKERRSIRDAERGYTWVGVPRMMRMPYRDEFGNPVFLDIRRWVPAGDIFDLSQGHGAFNMPAPLQFGGPLMLGMELAFNKSAFTGDPITGELTDTGGEAAGKIADHLWKSWMPSAAWVPGSWYWNKIGLSMRGAVDSTGRPYPLPEAVASSFGIKLKPQDVEQNLMWRRRELDKARRGLNYEQRRLGRLRDRNVLSEESYLEGLEAIDAKRRNIDKRERRMFPPR